MTDRHSAYLVTLSADVRADDAEEGVLNAIRMLKGVISVEPVGASPFEVQIATQRARSELKGKLLDVLNED